MTSELVQIDPEVREALADGRGVVALETTLVSHGFPHGEGAEVGRESERRIRSAGAIPAMIGILDGRVRIGLSDHELERFDDAGSTARKVGPRDVGAALAQRAVGATTVGGTLVAMAVAGIRFMGTGGLGGVHRGFPAPADISADLGELTRARALVVSAGVKSLLDVPTTMELLETLGIAVLGWRTDEAPSFYAARGGGLVSARVESAAEAARVASAHWAIGRCSALVLARPPDESLDDVESLIQEALRAAEASHVRGQAVTPFVLSYLHDRSNGRTSLANKEFIAANAGLAGEVAVEYASLDEEASVDGP